LEIIILIFLIKYFFMKNNSKTVLVTGVTGFLASQIAQILI